MSRSKAEIAARLPQFLRLSARAGFLLATSASFLVLGVRGTQNAVANGDTRTITIKHMHTKEETTVTFKRDGRYDSAGLEKLNWALRDWRIDEPIRMDPRLFDIAWEVHRKVGSDQPFHVVSAYRSPGTNSMLRRRSRGVAKHSQHMLGKAMDFYLPDTPTARMREVAMRMQRGGVGFYPGAHTPFVHLDAGSVRSWPRMTRDQLVRLFPDEQTVHLPADGKPLAGYEVAKAAILSSGGSVMGYGAGDYDEGAIMASGGGGKSFWAALFGGDDEEADARPTRGRTAAARRAPTPQPTVMAYAGDSNSGDGGRFAVFNAQPAQPEPSGRSVLRERSNRATTTTAPPPEETQVAALAPAQVAPPEPSKPSPIATALPVARPSGLTPPVPNPPAGSSQLAALAAEATALPLPASEQKLILASLPPRRPTDLPGPSLETILTGKAVSAPLPPSRPVALASLSTEGLRLSDDAEDTVSAIPAGAKLVAINHPMPPIRPRPPGAAPEQAGTTQVAARPRSTPIAAEYNADRAGLDSLFAAVSAPEAPPARRATVATAKAKAGSEAQAKGWVAGASPAASLGFSAAEPSDVGTSGFSGPAVKALPTTFVQN
ncbi:Uncharacterized conserved protein YcbK, DUF882 family [Bosea lupini]|uniref:Murein endopeptidase K n=1 Tax=Bosea lupini TaxID=1036779 RepID=A0A1H7SQM2_9HYPH|nr:DUF882 domain-containing protein [Bosea lupini]SEL74793.1 Uncharacterized conserved protein YcbK, DUF882 family [Bosea lupini]